MYYAIFYGDVVISIIHILTCCNRHLFNISVSAGDIICNEKRPSMKFRRDADLAVICIKHNYIIFLVIYEDFGHNYWTGIPICANSR